MTEELNICGAEDDDAPEGRCAGVQLGQDGRCIAHTDDRKAREAAFERLRGGGDLDFTQGVPIDGDLLSAILEACTQIDGRRRLHNANFGSSRFVSVARFMAVSFADWARFDGASFGDGARFEGAKFGAGTEQGGGCGGGPGGTRLPRNRSGGRGLGM